jgi:lysozyme family protein
MKGNLTACLTKSLAYEGGYVDHPDDPGGATNMGITIGTLSDELGYPATKPQVRNLTRSKAEAIYERRYWRPIRGDDLPLGVDLSAFDYGINSGVSRSAKDLQRVVGAAVDGDLGDQTLKAVARMKPAEVVKAHCGRRMSFVKSLAIWNSFGKGWSRRIADVEATALSWLLTKNELEVEAAKAARTSKQQTTTAVATGTTGGTGIAIDQGANVPVLVIVIAIAAVAIPLIIRAVIHAQRASALKAVAQEA